MLPQRKLGSLVEGGVGAKGAAIANDRPSWRGTC
jgi:hypothetical protein